MSTSYLNSIHYFLDEQHEITELSFIKNDPSSYEKYTSSGVQYHYKTDKSSVEVAYWVLSKFIESHPEIQSKIDIIIFTTNDFDKSGDMDVVAINSILNELGLSHAFPIFQGHSNCANVSACFHTACCMVESGKANNVLVVSVDNFGGEDQNYRMKNEMSILSDAGVCLWLSSQPLAQGFAIENIFLKNNPMQWIIDTDIEYQTSSLNKLKLYKNIANQVKKQLTKETDHFILNNYFKHINTMFLGMFNVSADKVDFTNVARTGHSPAGDSFINLSDLYTNDKIKSGQTIVSVTDSPSVCIGIVLQKL